MKNVHFTVLFFMFYVPDHIPDSLSIISFFLTPKNCRNYSDIYGRTYQDLVGMIVEYYMFLLSNWLFSLTKY